MRLFQILNLCTTSVRQRFKSGFSFRAKGKSQPDSRQWELTASETAAYHRCLAQASSVPDLVDDRTWSDLEMERIFLRFNKCVTPLGAQYLYALLRNYQSKPAALEANVKAYETFKSNPEGKAALQKALAGLNRGESAQLAGFLLGSGPEIPTGHRLFYLVSILAIACPLGLGFSLWFLPACIALWSLNIVLYYVYTTKLLTHAPALISLATLLGCVPEILQAVQDKGLPELRELQASAVAAKRIHKKISRAFLRRDNGDDFVRTIIEYLNLLCLFELTALCRALRAVNHERRGVLHIFQFVARLDAMQGISSVLAEYPFVCAPEVKTGRRFSLTDVQHPLVSNPVCNTIEGDGNSLLLTGTNMAGKTTFIKTLAVNLLFAQTLGVCLARQAVLPPARVRTLIAREDLITSGQSYFYFEASELLRMLKEAEKSGREYWFVLDEIFRGTNTLERVSAGSAVLGHLTSRGVVIASTHDHELADHLRNEFELYHFSEVINGSEARFDYLLRKGPCTTRNAIKLLVLAGFPKDVTDLAEKLATSPKTLSPARSRETF